MKAKNKSNKPESPPGDAPRGKRGPQKGAVYAKTLKKEELRELYRDLAAPHLSAILRAQLDSAIGINHFMLRDPVTGQFSRITDPDQILAALNAPEEDSASRYLIYAKDPNQQAASDILNRVLDKPKEQEQDLNVQGALEVRWGKVSE